MRPVLPALLTAFAVGAAGVPAHAALVEWPAASPPHGLLAASDSAASRPVQVQASPAARSAPGDASRVHASALDCNGAAACTPAGGDDERYDFYWRISVAADAPALAPRVAMSGTGARPAAAGPDNADARAADLAALDEEALRPASLRADTALGPRGPWLFVDGSDSRLRRREAGFVLVADADPGPGAARLDDARARLPTVDEQVDALPEPPAGVLLAAGLPLLALALRRRRRRR